MGPNNGVPESSKMARRCGNKDFWGILVVLYKDPSNIGFVAGPQNSVLMSIHFP
jgi:hypothetical protein